jgi:hypothetical protein
MTRFAALDVVRAQQRERRAHAALREGELPESEPQDNIAALLDSSATEDAVRAAMRTAIARGDALTARTVTTWLDMADLLGRAPSTREVAEKAQISHTSVATALKRFRDLLSEM